jgi:hypothetical protein
MSKQSTRRMVTLTAKQDAWLLRKSERLGISVSELIRRIIDEHRKEEE